MTPRRGWAVASVDDVADVLDSQRVPVNRKERALRPGNVPYYGATGQVGWIDAALFDEELCLVGEDGAPFLDRDKPKAYLIDGPSWVNNHAHVLRARPITSNRYLKYVFDAADYGPVVNGTTRLKLTRAGLARMPIPLPPLAEQRRIVAGIDEQFSRLDTAANNLRRVIRWLDQLERSLLVRAVAPRDRWSRVAFADEFQPVSDEGRKVKKRDYLPAGQIPVIDQGEGTIAGFTDDADLAYRGALPVIAFGDHTRRFKLIDDRFAVGADGVKLIAPNAAWIPRFAQLALQAVDLPDRGYSRHYQFLRRAILYRPWLPEQSRIVEEHERQFSLIQSLRSTVEAAQQRSGSLRRTILERAFRGELVPQDPDDEPASVLLERIRAERAAAPKPTRRKQRVAA